VAIIGLLLLAAGAVLLALGQLTPPYTDAHAYETALQGLLADYTAGRFGGGGATELFYDLQDRYGTRRWLYMDIAATSSAWGGAALGIALTPAWTSRPTTNAPVAILPLVAVAIGLFFFGLANGPLLLFQREQLPIWADSVGIPIFGAMFMAAILALLLALLVLPPLYSRREPRGLFRSGRGRTATIFVTVFYLPPLAGAACLLLAAPEPGGWLLTLSGWLMSWLLLNARAYWLGVKPGR
jgi:hypothetical protein